MINLTEEQEFAVEIGSAVAQLFDKESEIYRYDLDKIDATAFFTGYIIAFSTHFNTLTGNSGDLIDSVNIANRLAFQYLQENGKHNGQEDEA
jgi:hypothetical protein